MLSSALFPAASKRQVQTILRFSIARSRRVFWRSSLPENCHTYFALMNIKHSRKKTTTTVNGNSCKRAVNTRGHGNLVLRCRIYRPKQSLRFLSCFSFAYSSTSCLAIHSYYTSSSPAKRSSQSSLEILQIALKAL